MTVEPYYYSKMTQIWSIDTKLFWEFGTHILVLGSTGGGKTAVLLLLVNWFFNNNETILWRDDGNHEIFCMGDVIPLKVFIPRGCTMRTKHEIAYFDVDEPGTILSQLDHLKINVVCYETFVDDMGMRAKFWADFLLYVPKYSMSNRLRPTAMVIDQLNEIASGARLQVMAAQEESSKAMYTALINFRKHRVRLIGGAHNYIDLLPGVRESFQYRIIKRTNREAVPEAFFSFQNYIEKLKINEAIVRDYAGNYTQFTEIEQIVKHRNIHIPFTISDDLEEMQVTLKDPKKVAKLVYKNIGKYCNEKGKLDAQLISTAWDLPLGKSYGVIKIVKKKIAENKTKVSASTEDTSASTEDLKLSKQYD